MLLLSLVERLNNGSALFASVGVGVGAAVVVVVVGGGGVVSSVAWWSGVIDHVIC